MPISQRGVPYDGMFSWEMPSYSEYKKHKERIAQKKASQRTDVQKIIDGYEVGDKVKIRKNLKYPQKYGGITFAQGMKRHRDKIVTISNIKNSLYGKAFNVLEDYGEFSWTEEMFEKRYL